MHDPQQLYTVDEDVARELAARTAAGAPGPVLVHMVRGFVDAGAAAQPIVAIVAVVVALLAVGGIAVAMLMNRGDSANGSGGGPVAPIARIAPTPAPAPEPATMPLEVYRQPAYAAVQGPSNRGPARVEYGPRESVPVNFEY